MSVEVKLIGGPAGGQRLEIRGDPMDPPLVLELAQAPAVELGRAGAEPVRLRRLVYRRAVSSLAHGPLWRYHFDGHGVS